MNIVNSCDGFYSDSLDVRFTKACDNKCSFCIERNGFKDQGMNVDEMIKSTVNSKKKNVLILGGEPFLYIHELEKYVDYIQWYKKEIYITTSLPKTIIENWDVFTRIITRITCLNISLQHYDYEENNKILNATSNHNRIDIIKKMCEDPYMALKCRVSINLVKGAIDNKEDLDKFISKMYNIGVRNIKINELQHCPDKYVSFEDIYGIKMNQPYSHGCQTNIVIPKYKDMKVTVKRSCFIVEKSREASKSDLFKLLVKNISLKKNKYSQDVLYEDGTISKGWKSSKEC